MDLLSCAVISILRGDSHAIRNAKAAEANYIKVKAKFDGSDVDNNISISHS